MLAVQVQYWSLQEQKRHNLVTETQTNKQIDIAKGELDVHRGQLAETGRHNQVMESISWGQLEEQARHNRATEAISAESNSIAWMNADTNRMNAETNRMHLNVDWFNAATNRLAVNNNYEIGMLNANTATRQADIAETNAQTQKQKVANDFTVAQFRNRIDTLNAQTNITNAETRKYEAEQKAQDYASQKQYREKMAEVEEYKAATDRVYKSFDTANKFINSGISAYSAYNEKHNQSNKMAIDIWKHITRQGG